MFIGLYLIYISREIMEQSGAKSQRSLNVKVIFVSGYTALDEENKTDENHDDAISYGLEKIERLFSHMKLEQR